MSEQQQQQQAVAQFTPQTGPSKGDSTKAHFNPVSLQYTVANTLENKGSGNNKKQFVTQSTGKLTMDLIFDTTHTGEDVRASTEKIARFMQPDSKKIPAVILFEWGAYKFQGMVESYKETIDFFAPTGVPLRASVNLTMSRQDKVFESSGLGKGTMPDDGLTPDAVVVPTPTGGGGPGGAAGLSNQLGAPEAARALAALNGQESLRFSAGASLAVGGSVSLGPPVAFASAGAGAGFGLGASAGAGGGAGVSAGAGISLGVSAGAGIGGGFSARAGAQVSAGVSASAGAFAGLRVSTSGSALSVGAKLDPQNLLPKVPSASLATDHGATFQVGGKASIEGSSSLRADVGASATLRSRIQFDEV